MSMGSMMNGHADKKPFRVVVVGSGITGLMASHALQKVNIDHIVLEGASEAAPPVGASIAIYPQGSRMLEQIGCLEAAAATTFPMNRLVNRRPDGSVVMESDLWKSIRENHGYELLFMERRELLEILYEKLPDKSKIHFGKRVKAVAEKWDGVEVFTQDGSSEKGDIVIACDGVHSLVREMMWRNAAKVNPGLITTMEKKTITTTWTCLIGVSPGEPGLGNDLICVHNDRYSFLVGAQPERTFFFVFFKVNKPYSSYTRTKWTDLDAEKAAASVADHPISETVVFGELWHRRYRGQMVDIEEGILEHWHFGRTVLVGDAVHKVTPNIALGGNTGMESVAVLINLLNQAVKPHPQCKPTKAMLNIIFQEYQEKRIPRVRKILNFSSSITRVQAWENILMKLVALYVLPYQKASYLGDEMAEIVKGAPKFDFLPISPYKKHLVPWDDEQKPVPAGTSGGTRALSLLKQQQLPLLGMLFALSSVSWLMGSRTTNFLSLTWTEIGIEVNRIRAQIRPLLD